MIKFYEIDHVTDQIWLADPTTKKLRRAENSQTAPRLRSDQLLLESENFETLFDVISCL